MFADSVEAIFDGENLTDWKDKDILSAYCTDRSRWRKFLYKYLNKAYSLDELADIEYFKMYVSAFADSAEAKNLLKTKAFQKLADEKKKEQYLEKLYTYIRSIESEKLLYFSLVYQQTTVIIKAPADNKEQKKFLGYDWSNRKGNEGIQIITPGGKMYDDSDRTAEGTLAHAIRQSFSEVVPYFADHRADFGSVVDTKDLLDFSRESFENQ